MTARTAAASPRTLLAVAGLCALGTVAAACSSGSRSTTAARGWDYADEPIPSVNDTPRIGQVRPRNASTTARGSTINTRVWHDPVARYTPTPATAANQPAADTAPEAGAHMSAALAAAESAGPSRPPASTAHAPATSQRPSDLPNIHEPFDTSKTTSMLDTVEGLSQITFAGEGAAFDPCISRDGRTLAFAGTHHRATADIYLVPVGGASVTQLTADPAHDIMPAISPDGSRIAFASSRSGGGNWDIFVMSSSGGQAVQLTSDPSRELHPTWSPDGQKIAFCRLGEVSGRWELWVQNVSQSRAAEFIGYGLYPRWCPTPGTGHGGRDRIVFQRARERGDRAFSIWTIDYKPGDAASPTEVASSATSALINPAWSADGRWITFASITDPSTATTAGRVGEADLWIVAADGSSRVNLTAGNFLNLAPTWASDGRIYFVSNRAGVDNIWSISTDRAIAAATGPAHTEHPETAGHDADHDTTAHVPTP